jgi:hypothetical protein
MKYPYSSQPRGDARLPFGRKMISSLLGCLSKVPGRHGYAKEQCMTPTQSATPPSCPVLRVSNAYHYTGAKRDLHKNLPTNIRTHRRYISSHSLFEWATWSTKFACGFAPPVAFVDPCLTKSLATRPSDFNLAHVPYIPWFSVNAHTDSRLTNSNVPHAHIRAN